MTASQQGEMAGSRGSQAGPPELVFHGWLRYHGVGTIRLGRTIGTRDASVWILRVVGQPFGNQHRMCLLDAQESEDLLAKLRSNGDMPLPVTVRGLLFSLQPGTDVYVVASRGGVPASPEACPLRVRGGDPAYLADAETLDQEVRQAPVGMIPSLAGSFDAAPAIDTTAACGPQGDRATRHSSV